MLFMIADNHFPAEKHKELVDRFEKVEEEKIGKGKHEELHQLLHYLKRGVLPWLK